MYCNALEISMSTIMIHTNSIVVFILFIFLSMYVFISV